MSKITKNPERGFLRICGWGWLLLLVIAIMSPCGAKAQEFRATISGTVSDPTGAVIPGASVVVQETQTGTINRTTSDNAGQYVVPFLLPGEYTITATKKGFETYERTGIKLQAQEHPIVNLALPVGNATQTVTVTAEAPLVDLANASIGEVISTESVADLPLNGRTPTVLSELSVGVITTAAPEIVHPFDNNAGNMWSIGGTPMQTSEVLMDGSPDLTLLGAQAYSPTQDSVQEVSVRPFDTDASFGHTIGGVINQITKSGTNTLHGTLYEFTQASALDGNLWSNGNSTPAKSNPVTHFNQYGLTAGGPILIPRIFNGKNKLFFFFAWEGLKDSTPASQLTTVPTDLEKAGDFSSLLTLSSANQLYEPNTGTLSGGSFTRTAVPHNCLTNTTSSGSNCGNETNAGITISPVAAAYMALFPEPNNTANAAPDGANNYLSNAPSIDSYNNEFGRLDFNLNDHNHTFFDFRHNNRTQVKNDYFGNGITGTTLLRENFGSTLDNVYTMNSTTVFDVRLNWTYFDEVHGTPGQAYKPSSVGLPTGMDTASEEQQLPYINFNGPASASCGSFSSFQCLGDTSSSLDPTTSYQVFGDVVKLLGRQTLKAGFDGRQYRLSVENFGDSSGSFTFATSFVNKGTGAAAQTFGGDLASLLYGLPTAGEYDLNARADYRSYYMGAFLQDDWRVNNHLTVNLGVRYDVNTPFGDKLGRTVSGFSPSAVNSASAQAAANFITQGSTGVTKGDTTVTVNGLNTLGGLTFPNADGGAPFQTNKFGFWSPRVGFSYVLPWFHEKTVLRGGFGVFVEPETLSSLSATTGTFSSSALSNQEGFSASTSYQATSNSYFTNNTTAGSPISSGTILSNPFPSGFTQPAGSSLGASTFLGSPAAISFLAPVQHDPYSERWNIGVQHSVTDSTLLEVLYVGNHALHLPVSAQNINATETQYLTTNPYTDFELHSAVGTAVTNPFKNLLPNGSSSFNGSTTSLSNLLVPYPQFGSTAITEENETIGQSWFNSALVHLEQRTKHGLTLTANYSFSKLIEQDSRLNDEDAFLTRRISPLDHTHHFTVGGTYDLPFGRGKRFGLGGGRLADEIAGGFVINAIYQFQSGPPVLWATDIPFMPGYGVKDIKSQPRNTNSLASGNPAITNASAIFGASSTTIASSCTISTSSTPPQPCDGTVSTGYPVFYNHYRTLPQTISSVRADGYNNLDASILKDFKFTEKSYFQLRFETFNTLNHPVFAQPTVSSPTSSTFGTVSSVAASSQPRQVQIGGRIVF
jgi:hypothetical protein